MLFLLFTDYLKMKLNDFPIRTAVSFFFQSSFNLGLVQWYCLHEKCTSKDLRNFHLFLEFTFVLLMFSLQKITLTYYISAGCSILFVYLHTTWWSTALHLVLYPTMHCAVLNLPLFKYALQCKLHTEQQYASLQRHQQRSVDTYISLIIY